MDAMPVMKRKENREVSVAAARGSTSIGCQYTRVQEIAACGKYGHEEAFWHCNMRRSAERESDVGTYFSTMDSKWYGIACMWAGAQKKTSVESRRNVMQ